MTDKKVDVFELGRTSKVRPEYQGENDPLLINQVRRTVNRVGRSHTAKKALAKYNMEQRNERQSTVEIDQFIRQ